MTYPTWREFFDNHAPSYEDNVFTKNTRFEVDFLLELFQIPSGAMVLDMGCGTGRHSIELANRGYLVTGVDLSPGMLSVARSKAAKANVDVRWIEADGKSFESHEPFDAAICLCEGGVGLADRSEEPVSHDLAMVRAIHAALKPSAPFLLTAMNGYALIRQMTDELVQNSQFDPSTMIAEYEDELGLGSEKTTMQIRERQFIAPEMVAMLHHVGFVVEHVWGGTAGEWGRRPIKLDEIEAMYVSRKRA